MANSFSKEERVEFQNTLKGFEDMLVLSGLVDKLNLNQIEMARSNDILWRTLPYQADTYEGTDQTLNFAGLSQLAVPIPINRVRSMPFTMSAKDYRDRLQEGSISAAAKDKLASDINVAIMDAVSNYSTIVVKQTGPNTGFLPIGAAASAMSRIGVPAGDRMLGLSPSDYFDVAQSLIGTARSFDNDVSSSALRDANVGRIANMNTFMLDYTRRLAAAAGGGGITINTLSLANRYVPSARTVALTGESANRDNRFQTITVSSTTNVKTGDGFTIAGVEEVNRMTRETTGVLKSFRVIQVGGSLPAGTMIISPPIVDSQGPSRPEKSYGNVFIKTPSATAAIVWLNTVDAAINPFWIKGSIVVAPGRLEMPADAGMQVMRARTASGFELVMSKQVDVKTLETLVRFDTLFGVANLLPEMNGIILFNQV